jgi:hypothetical protein
LSVDWLLVELLLSELPPAGLSVELLLAVKNHQDYRKR